MRSVRLMRRFGAIALMLAVLACPLSGHATSARGLLNEGKDRLEEGNGDFALLYFRELLRDYPDSRYAVEAQFLMAEHYYKTRNYFQADKELRSHLKKHPDSPYAEQVQQMLTQMEVLNLEQRALKAMEQAEYRIAKVLWEDVLAKNPDSATAKRNLAECERIIERMDYQKRQLENERERIEAESKAIAKLLDEAKRQRAEAERIREEAAEMDARTREKYESALEAANKLSAELEERIEQLEADLKLWRDRARKYEARLLQAPDIGPLEGIATSTDMPKIIFEGPEADPSPESGEQQPDGLLAEASPSVVLINEYLNRETNVLKAEMVVGVDLQEPWPKDGPHSLKLRINFTPKPAEDGSTQPAISKTIYYSLADMDDVDPRNRAYRKKLIVAVDKNTIDTYAVAAYFVEKTAH